MAIQFPTTSHDLTVDEIRINHLLTPFIDRAPVVSWRLGSKDRGAAQSSARIEILTEDGKRVLDKTVRGTAQITPPLEFAMTPLTRYTVRVSVSGRGGATAVGETFFFTGLIGSTPRAKWIRGANCVSKDKTLGAVYMRKEFILPRARRCLMVVCGLGYFEAHLNGRRIGDEYLSTPYTAYDQQVQYRAFDVTELVRTGENAIGVILGNGFYNCFTSDAWHSDSTVWRDLPKLLLEIHCTDDSGNETAILSGPDWKASFGPITFNGIRHGEEYDARLEMPGWDNIGFDDGSWSETPQTRAPGGLMHIMETEPIRVLRRFHPVGKRKTKNGWIMDTGYAQSGVSYINYHGKKGDTVTVRYSDRIDEDGELDQKSLSGFVHNYTFQTDRYTKKSDAPEKWHATFTFHGFQYLEISGNDWEPELEDVEVWSLGNDFPDRGSFSCGNEYINNIQTMAIRSSRSVCFSVLNADSTREKLSWTGDTGLSAEQFLINFASEAFLEKWLADMRDTQRPSGILSCIVPSTGFGYCFANGPDWSQPLFSIPRLIYDLSGDIRPMRDNYEALCKYIRYIDSMANDHICSFGLGDWCAPFEGPAISVNMGSFKCPTAVTDTAYYYAFVREAAHEAHLLKRHHEAAAWRAHASEIRDAFRRHFFDKMNRRIESDCQTAYAFMIAFGLFEPEELPDILSRLREVIIRDNDHLDVGVLGMQALLEALGRTGNVQLMADLLTAPGFPSMRDWIDKGATTLWECWNGGGSHNHHMFSCVSAFFYHYIAGIRADKPGYSHIIFEPPIESSFGHAEASIMTPYGLCGIKWEKSDSAFAVSITVPVSCTAELRLPQYTHGRHLLSSLTESGRPLNDCALIRTGRDGIVRVPSGEWTFRADIA